MPRFSGGGRRGAGTGDVNGPASSVDSEVALFSGTGGKTVKRATGSGVAKLVSGVLSLVGLVSGDIPNNAANTTGKAAKADALNSATTVVNVAAAAAPTTGQQLTATDSTHATWQTPAAGGISQADADARYLLQNGSTNGATSQRQVFSGELGAADKLISVKGFWVAVRTITSGSGEVVTIADDVLLLDASDGPVAATLPPIATAVLAGGGQRLTLRFKRVDAESGNVVTLAADGLETIDGNASISFALGQARDLIPGSNGWLLF